MVCNLVSIYFDSPELGHTIKTNCIEFKTIDPEILLIMFFRKESGNSLSTTFCVLFFKKNVSHVIF